MVFFLLYQIKAKIQNNISEYFPLLLRKVQKAPLTLDVNWGEGLKGKISNVNLQKAVKIK